MRSKPNHAPAQANPVQLTEQCLSIAERPAFRTIVTTLILADDDRCGSFSEEMAHTMLERLFTNLGYPIDGDAWSIMHTYAHEQAAEYDGLSTDVETMRMLDHHISDLTDQLFDLKVKLARA